MPGGGLEISGPQIGPSAQRQGRQGRKAMLAQHVGRQTRDDAHPQGRQRQRVHNDMSLQEYTRRWEIEQSAHSLGVVDEGKFAGYIGEWKTKKVLCAVKERDNETQSQSHFPGAQHTSHDHERGDHDHRPQVGRFVDQARESQVVTVGQQFDQYQPGKEFVPVAQSGMVADHAPKEPRVAKEISERNRYNDKLSDQPKLERVKAQSSERVRLRRRLGFWVYWKPHLHQRLVRVGRQRKGDQRRQGDCSKIRYPTTRWLEVEYALICAGVAFHSRSPFTTIAQQVSRVNRLRMTGLLG